MTNYSSNKEVILIMQKRYIYYISHSYSYTCILDTYSFKTIYLAARSN